MLPLLALTLEVEKKIAWPSDDFVGVSMFRRYESVRRQEGVVWRGDESLRVVGGVRVALSKVVRPRSPAGLLRAQALALLLGAGTFGTTSAAWIAAPCPTRRAANMVSRRVV